MNTLLKYAIMAALFAGLSSLGATGTAHAQNGPVNGSDDAEESSDESSEDLASDEDFDRSGGPSVRSAVVDAGGTLVRGSNVDSAASLGTGFYEVIFNRNIRNCVYTATIGQPLFGVADTGFITVASRFGNRRGVFVATSDRKGRSADRPFHLVVTCW